MKLLVKSEGRQISEFRQEQERIRKEEKALEKMDVMIRWEMAKIEREKSSVSETQYTLMVQDMERLQTEWQHRSEDLRYQKEMYVVQTSGLSEVSFVGGRTVEENDETSKLSRFRQIVSREVSRQTSECGMLFTTAVFGGVFSVVTPIIWGIGLLF